MSRGTSILESTAARWTRRKKRTGSLPQCIPQHDWTETVYFSPSGRISLQNLLPCTCLSPPWLLSESRLLYCSVPPMCCHLVNLSTPPSFPSLSCLAINMYEYRNVVRYKVYLKRSKAYTRERQR